MKYKTSWHNISVFWGYNMKSGIKNSLHNNRVMHLKESFYFTVTIFIATFFIGGTLLFFINNNKYYSTLITMGCDAVMYKQEALTGTLTITYDNPRGKRDISVKVNNASLQNDLSKAVLEDVIGVTLELRVPYKILKEQHTDVDNLNLFEYLSYDTLDNYLILTDVYYK